jgi:hypothetical protein
MEKLTQIPKKIHYCWFGRGEMPKNLMACMNTWKEIMPDYEIICWNEDNFDVNFIPFTSEAFSVKKWAFISDYARLYALYNEGGIYLDTDVIVKKTFDVFLNNDFFSAVEFHPKIVKHEHTLELLNDDGTIKNENSFSKPIPGIGMLTAVIGAKPKHPFIKDCMDYYHQRNFISPSGEYDTRVNTAICSRIGMKYGFRYKDSLQQLENVTFYPSSVFAGEPSQFTKESFAFHYAENSWQDRTVFGKFVQNLKKNNFLRLIFRKTRI